MARSNVDALLPHVRAGKKVVAINPTCSYMMRKEYAELVGTPEAERSGRGHAWTCASTCSSSSSEGKFNRDFRSTPGKVAYHVPCHLKAQNIGFRSRDMMRLIPGATINLVDQCSGHDGTWAMKKEFFPLSMLAGKKAFDEMSGSRGRHAGHRLPAGRHPVRPGPGHAARSIPIQVLARAYRADGFPQQVKDERANA